jgi:hypothetical protein
MMKNFLVCAGCVGPVQHCDSRNCNGLTSFNMDRDEIVNVPPV